MPKTDTTELRIRAVPIEIHRALKYHALDVGMSLNTLLIELLRSAMIDSGDLGRTARKGKGEGK